MKSIVIIQQEIGIVKVQDNQAIIVEKKSSEPIDENLIKEVIRKFAPDRIIIELNGMEDINETY